MRNLWKSIEMLLDKVYVGLENAPRGFDLCGRVLGQGGANLDFIRSETGAMVILKGGTGDQMNPLHLALNHSREDRLAAARQLAVSLVESIRQEFQQWSSQNAPPVTAPVVPALNVPPPMLVNPPPVQIAPAPNPAMPPPGFNAPVPLNVAPMQHQVLQLVPQQQIFVAPDGTHYVKVTFAQTPTANVAPITAVAAPQPQVNVMPQQMQMPQQLQPPPNFMLPAAVQTPVQVLAPSVCTAPTLSTATVAQRQQQQQWPATQNQQQVGTGGMQPWGSAAQPTIVPAPQMHTVVPPPAVHAATATQPWAVSATPDQTTNSPWGDVKPDSQQPTNQGNALGGNLPWYKNAQNPPTVAQPNIKLIECRQQPKGRIISDEWMEKGDNNMGSGRPSMWDPGSAATSKTGMPDLLEEINKEKEEFNENHERPPRGGDRSRSNRDTREYYTRRDRRDRRRRPYTDADTYRRQFRSGGVLGEERYGERKDENAPGQEFEDQEQTAGSGEQQEENALQNAVAAQNAAAAQNTAAAQNAASAQNAGAAQNAASQGRESRDSGQVGQGASQRYARFCGGQGGRPSHSNVPNSPNSSKWDRPAVNSPQGNQYNQPGNYNQHQNQQYQQPNQYQPTQLIKPPSNYQLQQQTSSDVQQGAVGDKQTPTTQYVGAPAQYTPSNSNWNQYYQNESKPTWSQSQHPWNRNAQEGSQYGGNQYEQRPWGDSPSHQAQPPHAPQPAQGDTSNNYNY